MNNTTLPRFTTPTDLIGSQVLHGSPGMENIEVIEGVNLYSRHNRLAAGDLWEVQFESGCFTVLKVSDFQDLLAEGECSYSRAAGFQALEQILIESPKGGWLLD